MCVKNLSNTGSDNGLSPVRRQAIIWTITGMLLIGPLRTNFNEILIEIHTFLFTKIHLKMTCGNWRQFCLGLNMLSSMFLVTVWRPGSIAIRRLTKEPLTRSSVMELDTHNARQAATSRLLPKLSMTSYNWVLRKIDITRYGLRVVRSFCTFVAASTTLLPSRLSHFWAIR